MIPRLTGNNAHYPADSCGWTMPGFSAALVYRSFKVEYIPSNPRSRARFTLIPARSDVKLNRTPARSLRGSAAHADDARREITCYRGDAGDAATRALNRISERTGRDLRLSCPSDIRMSRIVTPFCFVHLVICIDVLNYFLVRKLRLRVIFRWNECFR